MPKKPIPFILLDGSQTTKDVRVLVSGVDTTQFERNPVMFYRHNDYELPIGTWTNIRKENNVLLADAVFDYEDTDKEVQRIIGKVERGIIKMASCGLVDLEVVDDPVYRVQGETDYTVVKCRLREASILPIGGNHNALRLFDKEGNEIDLSDGPGLKLSDFIVKPKIENNMYKNYLSKLNLADTATEAEFYAKVDLLLADKVKVDGELTAEKLKVTAAETAKTELQTKIDAIELADKTAKKTAFDTELTLALADGRLTEKADGSVKASMLQLFDLNPESSMTMLKGLTPHKSASLELGDGGNPTGETAFQKRKREIDEANAAKKKK